MPHLPLCLVLLLAFLLPGSAPTKGGEGDAPPPRPRTIDRADGLCVGHHPRHGGFVAQIGHQAGGGQAQCLQFGGAIVDAIAGGHQHRVQAGLGQALGAGETDTAGAARTGDDGDGTGRRRCSGHGARQ